MLNLFMYAVIYCTSVNLIAHSCIVPDNALCLDNALWVSYGATQWVVCIA